MAAELSVLLLVHAGISRLDPGSRFGLRLAALGLLLLGAVLAVHHLDWSPGIACWLASLMIAAIGHTLLAGRWPAVARGTGTVSLLGGIALLLH